MTLNNLSQAVPREQSTMLVTSNNASEAAGDLNKKENKYENVIEQNVKATAESTMGGHTSEALQCILSEISLET